MRLNIEEADQKHISGWVEGDRPVIAVVVDDVVLGHATTGETRPDVSAYFDCADRVYRNFRFEFGSDHLKLGSNTVRVEIAGAPDGDGASMNAAVERKASWQGFCHACERDVTFSASSSWYRDTLLCESCGSAVRERALARVLQRLRPSWRDLTIHESSPAAHGYSAHLRAACRHYVGSHYLPALRPGEFHDGYRNENLEKQTFADDSFDVVITLDVMEHVFDPAAVYAQVYRTLRPGGIYVHTYPIRKWLVEPVTPRVRLREDGGLDHLVEPEIHGNPVDPDGGSIVTYDYGYDIHQRIAEWAPFDVEVIRFSSKRLGLLGEYTEVVVCTKP